MCCWSSADIMDDAFHCFVDDDVQTALVVEPLEETIDQIIEEIRMRHIRRFRRESAPFSWDSFSTMC